MSKFGDRIKHHREERRLKQADFVAHGISQSQLSQFENGAVEPSVEKIEQLGKALGIPPTDLVMGTELQPKYLAHGLTPDDVELRQHALQLKRSQRLIAVEEAFRRIQLFHDLLYAGAKHYTASVDNEAHYQHAARIVVRALGLAADFEPNLREKVYLPGTLLDPDDEPSEMRFSIKKSQAYIRSLVLEFPEADTAAEREKLSKELGLDRIDSHLSKFLIYDSTAAIWLGEMSGEADEDEIPF